jgi:hypothetical protein
LAFLIFRSIAIVSTTTTTTTTKILSRRPLLTAPE